MLASSHTGRRAPTAEQRVPHNRPARRRGASLLEGLLVAALAFTLAAAATAHFAQWRQTLRVEQVAAAFETDVQLARSLAQAHRDTVRLSIEPAPDGACWLLHSGPRGSCRCEAAGQARCEGAAQVFRVAHWPDTHGLQVHSNARHLSFDGISGTVTPAATVRFVGEQGRSLHQVVSIMGRVRSCSPSAPWAGYKAC
jgi:type IV fimbrial biogenesis protein FimT